MHSAPLAFIPAQSDYGLSTANQSSAGAAAQAATKLLFFPLDTWKSRRQAARLGDGRGVWTLSGMYRGVVPKLLLYTPYQALYMAVYVRARDRLVQVPALGGGAPAFVLAGVAAEVCGSLVRLPMEVAKLRMQLGLYGSTLVAARAFVRRPGAFYGSFLPQTLLHDCVYSACAWLLFESGRQRLFAFRGTTEIPAHETLALGGATGALTALATTPLDVVKTRVVGRLPGHGGAPSPRPGVRAVARALWRDGGPWIFCRGAGLRVAHLAPSHALYMLLYEVAKERLAAWLELGAGG